MEGVLVMLLAWAVPISLIVYLFRTLSTILEGLRSINEATQRIAAAVERMERDEARQANH